MHARYHNVCVALAPNLVAFLVTALVTRDDRLIAPNLLDLQDLIMVIYPFYSLLSAWRPFLAQDWSWAQ